MAVISSVPGGNGGRGSIGDTIAVKSSVPGGKGGSGSIGDERACPVAKTAIMAPKTKLRRFNEVEIMDLAPCEAILDTASQE
jgi:hypothetical protein